MVQKALLDVVQAILEQADSLPAMSQSLYRTNVFVYKDTDEIAPDIRNHDDGEQIGHTLTIPDMRAFDVEAAYMLSFQIYIIKLDSNSPGDMKELSEWVSNQIESTPVECQDDRSILTTVPFKLINTE